MFAESAIKSKRTCRRSLIFQRLLLGPDPEYDAAVENLEPGVPGELVSTLDACLMSSVISMHL
jgi:hypothetical protein